MKKKSILLLGHLPPPIMGPSIATKIILDSSLSNYYDITSLDTNTHSRFNQIGRFHFQGVLKTIFLYLKQFKIIKKEMFDLALIPISQSLVGFMKDSFFIIIARKMNVPVLVQLRGSNFNSFIANKYIDSYVRYILSKTSGAIVLHSNYKYLFKKYLPENKIFDVTNGVDISIKRAKQKGDKIKILFLSNMLKSKGILDVLDAFSLAIKDNENIELTLAGSCKDIDVREKIDSMKNQCPIKYVGLVNHDEKLECLKNADIFVFTPNMPEGLPWSIIEALAAGLPIIINNLGNGCELVENNKNGFVVSSSIETSDKIVELSKNKNLRDRMSYESKKIYLSRFTEQNMVDQYIKVFNSIYK